MQFFYRIFYHPLVNRLVRNTFSLLGNALPQKLRIPISGPVKLQISPEGHQIRLRTNPTNSMAKLVYWSETHNHEYTDLFIRLLPQVSVFMDIGASIGYYSIVGKTLKDDLIVHAFEPADGPFHYLQQNFRDNAFREAVAHNIAISDQEGKLSFYAPFNAKYRFLKHHLGGDGSLQNRPENNHLKEITVQTRTLDQMVDELQLDRIDLMKLDTESTEDQVLTGGAKSIHRFRPIIISEVLYNKIETKLDAILTDWDYLIYRHRDGQGLELISQLARNEDDGASNFFFVPKEKQAFFEEVMI
ncbi:MAG: FkbM family methyltransferase [Bacteroidota bacterium]